MSIVRKGMWANVTGRVGIVAELERPIYVNIRDESLDDEDGPGYRLELTGYGVDFHFVDNKGETIETAVVPYGAVSRAAYLDIPEARRPTEEAARKFGYL